MKLADLQNKYVDGLPANKATMETTSSEHSSEQLWISILESWGSTGNCTISSPVGVKFPRMSIASKYRRVSIALSHVCGAEN